MSIIKSNIFFILIGLVGATFLIGQSYPPPQHLSYNGTYDFNYGDPINCYYLSWESPDTNNISSTLSHYKVYRQVNWIDEWSLSDSTDSLNLVECFSTDYIGTAYYITACYINPEGESEPSNVLPVDPLISTNPSNIISNYSIGEVYPNPFNPNAALDIELTNDSFVQIITFDICGKKVEDIISKSFDIGNYTIIINANNYSSGLYYLRILINNEISVRKCVVIK